jgi:hypothetical protein
VAISLAVATSTKFICILITYVASAKNIAQLLPIFYGSQSFETGPEGPELED